MKLVQFHLPSKGVRLGFVDKDMILDITVNGVSTILEAVKKAAENKTSIDEIIKPLLDDVHDTGGRSYTYNGLDIPPDSGKPYLLMPIFPPEVWGFGVTYKRSARARDADTGKEKGMYDYVYSAPRPETFFKATTSRCVGPNDFICIRSDSRLTATEPELGYVLSGREIVGYTVCNDVSAWDIERENPLYLPQSKIFKGCFALGPAIVTPSELKDPYKLEITCSIIREGNVIFEEATNSSKIKRRFEELTEFLCRDNPIPIGTVVSTGTGIMVPNEFALKNRDIVKIEIEGIGILSNPVRQL